MAKMKKKWAVLCSTAVLSVYTAGYLSTGAPSSAQQLPLNTQANVQSHTQSSNQVAAPSLYKNGTFMGMGSNRRGSIEVAVTINNDKITNVEISRFAMHYSMRDVVGMPQEVVQIQSAQVRNVSGATYSTEAFKDAIKEALAQAMNA